MKLSILLFATLCLVCVTSSMTTTKVPAHHITKHVSDAVAHTHAKTSAGKQDEHKHAKKTGKDAKHHVETAHKGTHGAINHKITDEEKALKKTASHSEGAHQSHKKSGAHQEHGAKFAEGAKHKKTGFTKGFHENYHKNEHKKHDSFYSHGKKSADWKSYAGKNSKHASHKTDRVEHKNKLGLKSLEQHGKAGKKASGHNVQDHKAHRADKGRKITQFEKLQKWGKKHQRPEDKQKYKYSQTH